MFLYGITNFSQLYKVKKNKKKSLHSSKTVLGSWLNLYEVRDGEVLLPADAILLCEGLKEDWYSVCRTSVISTGRAEAQRRTASCRSPC